MDCFNPNIRYIVEGEKEQQEIATYTTDLEWNDFSIIHKYGGFEEEVFNDDSEKQVFVCQCKFGY